MEPSSKEDDKNTTVFTAKYSSKKPSTYETKSGSINTNYTY